MIKWLSVILWTFLLFFNTDLMAHIFTLYLPSELLLRENKQKCLRHISAYNLCHV